MLLLFYFKCFISSFFAFFFVVEWKNINNKVKYNIETDDMEWNYFFKGQLKWVYSVKMRTDYKTRFVKVSGN